jgi:2-methylisocitrate lyase-like PEP mutase family enzyme
MSSGDALWGPPRGPGLRQLLAGPGLVVAPGCYDVVTARLVEHAGFQAAYMTGSGVSMSTTGLPDIGLVSLHEVLVRLEQIAGAIRLPVIADGDTGFGNPLNVLRTVREFERRGAAAIQLEDQEMPKKCGHEPGRRVVPVSEMVAKIEAARFARASPDFLIVARTDARTTHGIEEAIARGRRYAMAGADVVFVESPETAEEMRAVCRAIPAPCLANMVEGGRTPLLPQRDLAEIGYRIVIYPNALTRVVARAGLELLDELKRTGTTAGMLPRMLTHGELWELFGREEWGALERRFVGDIKPLEET